MFKRVILVGLILVSSAVMAGKVTEHTTPGGEKITVKTDKNNYGSTTTGGKYGDGTSTSQTHKEANQDVKNTYPGSTSKTISK